jgi:hypothetical protein
LNRSKLQFEENSQLYELQRLRDTKRLVSEYVAAQIAFHCKAIENLSAAAQAVASFNPDLGMDVRIAVNPAGGGVSTLYVCRRWGLS